MDLDERSDRGRVSDLAERVGSIGGYSRGVTKTLRSRATGGQKLTGLTGRFNPTPTTPTPAPRRVPCTAATAVDRRKSGFRPAGGGDSSGEDDGDDGDSDDNGVVMVIVMTMVW